MNRQAHFTGNDDTLKLEGHLQFGIILCVAFFALVFIWGGLAKISGAVIAPGRISVESNAKRIQHKEGGIVAQILVKEGERVSANQLVARLDSTLTGANAAIVDTQYWQLKARKIRLEAEKIGQYRMAVSRADLEAFGPYKGLLDTEQAALRARLSAASERQSQLQEQVHQAQFEIEGQRAQIAATKEQSRLITGELEQVRDLNQRGFAPITRVNQLQRESERLRGEQGQLEATIARIQTRISEINLQLSQLKSERLDSVNSELTETEAKLTQLGEQRRTTTEALQRVEIRSPVDGRVQNLSVHTLGGVVSPGETLMLIIPSSDELIVEARVDPQHIDQVKLGRKASVRFTSFASQTTPEATAVVRNISPDVERDDRTGSSYYIARLTISDTSMSPSLKAQLVAGMPVEVHIETSSRSALSYFLKPMTDQILRTFRED